MSSHISHPVKPQKFWYYTACTLNGYIADENNSLDWLFSCTQPVSDPMAFQHTIGVIVCGSHTLEWILNKYDVIENPERWQSFFGTIPMVVFSSRKLTLPRSADITVINSSAKDALSTIQKLSANKDIWLQGGGDIARQFFDAQALTHLGINYIATTTHGGVNVFPHRIPLHNICLTSCKFNAQSWYCEFTLSYSPEVSLIDIP